MDITSIVGNIQISVIKEYQVCKRMLKMLRGVHIHEHEHDIKVIDFRTYLIN